MSAKPSILEYAKEFPRTSVEIVSGDSITLRAVSWLWPGWLALGKLHILAGPPGTGKTTIALAFAATVTTGGQWPDGGKAICGDVVMWSGEDDPSDTLLPRFIASSGDPRRLHFVQGMREGGRRRPFDPSIDVPALLEDLRARPNIRVVIVDPIVSAIAGDSHKNAEVRRGLQPLVDFAAEMDIVLLGITHFTKNTAGRDPVERVTGSLAFAAMARLVMVTAKPVEADGKRRLVRAKSNYGPDSGGFEYDLRLFPLPGLGIDAQRVEWGEALDGTARDLLNDVEQPVDGTGGGKLAEAEAWLRDALGEGPVAASDLERSAKANGHSWQTIKRAKAKLGVIPEKLGMAGGWAWRLPIAKSSHESGRGPRPPEEGQQNHVDSFGEVDPLREPDWEMEW